jgi:CheY-like chemotaxis protein
MGTILVVDDDEGVRTSLCELLEDEGHRPIAAANGREALRELRAGARPCVIFLDLMMPVMDGWTFRAEQLNDPHLKDIPVVVITAGGPQMASSLPAQNVLQKPVNAERILEVVASFCPA